MVNGFANVLFPDIKSSHADFYYFTCVNHVFLLSNLYDVSGVEIPLHPKVIFFFIWPYSGCLVCQDDPFLYCFVHKSKGIN